MAAIGVAMVAVSGYYLYAYMRSGSDAESFNVAAAAPEEMLTLLGQGLPEPVAYEPIRPQTSRSSAQTEPDEVANARTDTQIDTRTDTRTVNVVAEDQFVTDNPPSVETVSISSVLPDVGLADVGLALANSQEPASQEPNTVAKRGFEADDEIVFEEPVAKLAPDDAVIGAVTDEPVATSSVSTEVMVNTFSSIYPGGNMNPRYWSEPHWAGNLPFGGPTIPEGFEPVDASDIVLAAESAERALRMRIPSIDLDATVSELELRDLGDSRAWSTPDKVVGHIPTTARPGELANGWYFGHLDDFLSNEGAIFRRLPEISDMIRNEPVDIFIATDEAEYLYRVTETQQLHRDELYLAESDNAQISLVTCWPFRVYDQRIVVSAVLIAVKPANEA